MSPMPDDHNTPNRQIAPHPVTSHPCLEPLLPAHPVLPASFLHVRRWVLYGISSAQLSNVYTPVNFAGHTYTVSSFLESAFDYHYGMRWWCVLIVFANMLAYRVASILLLRYKSYLKR